MITIAVLESTVTCPGAQKSVNHDANVPLEHILIDLDSVSPLVTKPSALWFKNVLIIRSGMIAVTAVVISTAVQAKNVFGHPVLLDAILAANVQVEWSQVQTILTYA